MKFLSQTQESAAGEGNVTAVAVSLTACCLAMHGELARTAIIALKRLASTPPVHWAAAAVAASAASLHGVPVSIGPVLTLPALLLASHRFGLTGGLVSGAVAAALLQMGHAGRVGAGEGWLTPLLCLLVGGIAGVLFGRLRATNARLEAAQRSTLRAFATAVESDEADVAEHCERVGHNSRVLGQALGLKPAELEELYWAGLLHDIGKLSIPREILQKPGGLTLEEYLVMRRHARLGANLLQSIDGFERIAEGIGSHHERWDGSGYPQGLAGREIPVYGRILAVVDVFEALSSDRPYRRALPPDLALEELRRNAGSHFDPSLVAVYEQLYLDGKIIVSSAEIEQEFVQPPLGLPSLRSSWGEAG